jgi:hypothetical protein
MKHITSLFTLIFIFGFYPLNGQTPDNTKDWTILETYSIPGKASGLAFDGTYLYFGIYGSNGDQVHRFDPATGISTLQFTNPIIGDSYGMTCDGTTLWITDHVTSTSIPAAAMQFDLSGSLLSQFDLPDHYMSGIAYDDGDFWVCTYYPDPSTIYRVDFEGTILDQFQSPGNQPWDICVAGSDLWVVDYNDDVLYKLNSGSLVESHACENTKPAGVVYDGQYLWYVDGGLGIESTLYKVDLGGAGTPQINIPVTTHNYGNVTINNSSTWDCQIQNTGIVDLEVSNLVIQNAVPIFVEVSIPFTIEPGGSYDLPIIYNPTEQGTLNTIITVQSNDPVTPEVELTLTGEAVYDGPHINIEFDSHNYGNVRAGATTRWFATIINDGNDNLEIENLSVSNSDFYFENNITLPISISPLESKMIGIWFHPGSGGNYSATATIEHNDISQGDVEIALSGSGIEVDYPMGEEFWNFTINTSYDNSIKGICSILDVTDDGVDDVIVSSEDDFVRCFNGNSSGTADIIWQYEDDVVYQGNGLTTISDINEDGYHDVIIGYAWGSRSVKALSGKTGELIWVYDTHIYGDGGWIYQVWAKYDYNSDGIPDVLAASGNDGNNTGPKRIFCLNGQTGIPLWEAFTNGANFGVIGVADFNGDDAPDVIGGASNSSETVGKVYGINGTNGSIEWEFTAIGSSVWALVQLDDLNNDGVADIGAGDFSGGFYALDPTNGNSIYNGSVGGNPIILNFETLDDVNGDGFKDFGIASSSTNAMVINGQSGDNLWLNGMADRVWNIDRIEDVSGDGINDLVAGTLYSSNYCYFIDGTNGDELLATNFGEPVDAISAISDINNDGSMEMVVGGREGKLYCYSGGMNSSTLNADFSADVTNGLAPLEVNFTDLSSGGPDAWEWDFDNDGTIDSYDQNPTKIFTEPGYYSVKLKILKGSIYNTIVKTNYIFVDLQSAYNNNPFEKALSIYPNPFDKQTNIKFISPGDCKIQISLFDIRGTLVRELYNGYAQQGENLTLIWDGTDNNGHQSPKGIYFLEINTNENTLRKKLILN